MTCQTCSGWAELRPFGALTSVRPSVLMFTAPIDRVYQWCMFLKCFTHEKVALLQIGFMVRQCSSCSEGMIMKRIWSTAKRLFDSRWEKEGQYGKLDLWWSLQRCPYRQTGLHLVPTGLHLRNTQRLWSSGALFGQVVSKQRDTLNAEHSHFSLFISISHKMCLQLSSVCRCSFLPASYNTATRRVSQFISIDPSKRYCADARRSLSTGQIGAISSLHKADLRHLQAATTQWHFAPSLLLGMERLQKRKVSDK